jgi:alpha-L-rhamnosidase
MARQYQHGINDLGRISDLPNSRSDCHAWGASPNIEFFRTVLGIDSYAPGFRKIKIEPYLGDLMNVSGEMPHPNGKIAVSYKPEKGKMRVNINLPRATTGVFVWKSVKYQLAPGNNSFLI